MRRTGWGGSTGCIMHWVHTSVDIIQKNEKHWIFKSNFVIALERENCSLHLLCQISTFTIFILYINVFFSSNFKLLFLHTFCN
jgi:hypothetical protein